MARTEHEILAEPEVMTLAPTESEPFMPALTIQQAVDRFNSVVEFVRTVMREGVDYGRIPGTDKPALLKPGAEKLCTLFGLSSRFQLIRSIEDWHGSEHNGEPFFYYFYRCQLRRGDLIMAEGDGSCNSFEQRYRYRDAQRKCPVCGQSAIIRGKEEYGGGWVCFRKKGGCGTKFSADDPKITSQPAGRVPNENIADQVNTIQKIAQKRSLTQATLLAVNGSEFFTQDVEDLVITVESAESNNERSMTHSAAAPPASFDDSISAGEHQPQVEPAKASTHQARKDLVDVCASLCRSLKTYGHGSFKDRDSIIKHLQQTAEAKKWQTEIEPLKLKGLSDLSADLLAEYAVVLERELEARKKEAGEVANDDPIF